MPWKPLFKQIKREYKKKGFTDARAAFIAGAVIGRLSKDGSL